MRLESYKLTIGQRVLVICSIEEAFISELVNKFKQEVGLTGSVEVISVERFAESREVSSFDTCFLKFDNSSDQKASEEVFIKSLNVLKLGGVLCIHERIVESSDERNNKRTESQLRSALRLSGFVDVSSEKREENGILICRAIAKKPAYEVGASEPLKINTSVKIADKKPTSVTDARQVWTLSANDVMDDDIELLDSDTILNESDLKRPDASSLKASCGEASAKRKACKNCTCGLAEQLDSENKVKEGVDPAAKSSACGSCYLGDAFRCAGCPYLGMPAFKAGEKVQLDSSKLQADI